MLHRVLPPGFIIPAQPVKRPGPPCGPSWVHEIKHDGYRLIVLKGATVRLFSRSGNDWTDRFPLITKAAQNIRGSFLIDGEAVVVGPDGLSLFDQLQSTAGRVRAVLFAFDLIQHDGEDQRARPLLERKKLLAKTLARSDGGILYNDHLSESGDVVFDHACKLGAEGIVSKRIDSSYQSGPVLMSQGNLAEALKSCEAGNHLPSGEVRPRQRRLAARPVGVLHQDR
jgi:bifunctional non-homologous end joining protein LigD